MRKKLLVAITALMVCMAGHAQFEKGKYYLGASMSGIGLSYNGSEKSKIGIHAKGGYLFDDNFMLTLKAGYDKLKDVPMVFSTGIGARYYIEQNGLFLGGGVDFVHNGDLYDDFMPTVHVGYAFFLSRTVTIEPELYYNQSFKNHGDYSTIGFRIGLGVYL